LRHNLKKIELDSITPQLDGNLAGFKGCLSEFDCFCVIKCNRYIYIYIYVLCVCMCYREVKGDMAENERAKLRDRERDQD